MISGSRKVSLSKPFSLYLADSAVMSQMRKNLVPFISSCSSGNPSFNLFLSVFERLPQLGERNRYFEKTVLFDQLVIVKQDLMAAYSSAKLDSDDWLKIVAIAQIESLDNWVKLAFAQALYDLFDTKGNIRPELCEVLVSAGISAEMINLNAHEIKWGMLTRYITVILQSSNMMQSIMGFEFPVTGRRQSIHMLDIFLHTFVEALQFNKKLMSDHHFAVVTDTDKMLYEQVRLHSMIGVDIHRLLRQGIVYADEVILAVLADTKLVEAAMIEYGLFDAEIMPDRPLQFFYSSDFLPEKHLTKNHSRVYTELLDAFDTAELDVHQFDRLTAMSKMPSVKQREALLLGTVVSGVTNWYVKTSMQPSFHLMKRIEIQREYLASIKNVLRGKLDQFVRPLEMISGDYYAPDTRSFDESAHLKEKIKSEFLRIGLMVALVKYECFNRGEPLLVAGEFEYPAALLNNEHEETFISQSSVAHSNLLQSVDSDLADYFSPEACAEIMSFPVAVRFYMLGVLRAMRVGYAELATEFIAALKALRAEEIHHAIGAFNVNPNIADVNRFVHQFIQLVSFDQGESEKASQIKHEAIVEIMGTLRNHASQLMDKDFLQGLAQICDHKLQYLQKIKECSIEYIALLRQLLDFNVSDSKTQAALKRSYLSNIRRIELSLPVIEAHTYQELATVCRQALQVLVDFKQVEAEYVERQVTLEAQIVKLREDRLSSPSRQTIEEASQSRVTTPLVETLKKWSPRILIGAALLLGAAALIVAALFSGGIIVVPLAAIVIATKLAITGFAVGGAFFGGGILGSIYEMFKTRSQGQAIEVRHGSSYQKFRESMPLASGDTINLHASTSAVTAAPAPSLASHVASHPMTRQQEPPVFKR